MTRKLFYRHSSRGLILGLCLFFNFYEAHSQLNKKAGQLFDNAESLFSQKMYDSAYNVLERALDLELDTKPNDNLFLLKTNYKLAGLCDTLQYYSNAYWYYKYALGNANAANNYQFGAKCIKGIMNAYYNVYYNSKRVNDFSDNPDDDSVVQASFRIVEFIDRIKDTIWVKINCGLNDGLVEKDIVKTYPNYGNDYHIDSLRFKYFAKGYVTETFNSYSIAKLIYVPKYANINDSVCLADPVDVNIRVRKNAYKGIFYNLALGGVRFKTFFGDWLNMQTPILKFRSAKSEEAMFYNIRNDFDDGLRYWENNPNDVIKEEITKGRFAGMTVREMFEKATILDIKQFINYVNEFPGSYSKANFLIINKFYHWASAGTPLEGMKPIVFDCIDTIEYDKLVDFISPYRFYLDSFTEIVEKAGDKLSALSNSGDYDGAIQLALKYEKIAKTFGYYALESSLIGKLGDYYRAKKEYTKALEYYEILAKNPDERINALNYESYVYYDMEYYPKAIQLLDTVLFYYPNYMSGNLMKGWILFKTGEFKKSDPYIRKSFLLDSTNESTVLNFAHLLLFYGKKDSANYYYSKSLNQLKSYTSYNSAIADFNLFIEKGLMEEQVKLTKEWYSKKYFENRYFYNISDSLYNVGIADQEALNYIHSVPEFKSAANFELKAKDIRAEDLRIFYRNAAYSYYKAKVYDSSVVYYKKGLAITRKYINNEEYLKYDYQAIRNIYDHLNDTLNYDIYDNLMKSYERRLMEKSGESRMYILSVGVDKYTNINYSFAANDANDFGTVLKSKSVKFFDTVINYNLTKKQATKQNVIESLNSISNISQPGDVFAFYFAGKSTKINFNKINSNSDDYFEGSENQINLIDNEYITNKELITYIKTMPATKFFIAFDAPNNGLVDDLVRVNDDNQMMDKDLFIISNGMSRVEDDSANGSLLGRSIINSINKAISNNEFITAKQLIGQSFSNLSTDKDFISIKDYSSGSDFNLFYAEFTSCNVKIQDTKGPDIIVNNTKETRNAKVGEMDSDTGTLVTGRANDANEIKYVLINGEEAAVDRKGNFSLRVKLKKEGETIVVKAADIYENESSVEVILNPRSKEDNNPLNGKSYALFFATNEYKEWNELSNPINDITAIADKLKNKFGFIVDTVLNPTNIRINQKIAEYRDMKFGPYDQLFIMFAGHGHNEKGDGFIITYNGEDHYPYDYNQGVEDLARKINNLPCKNILLMLDICFGGATFDRVGFYPDRFKSSSPEKEQKKYMTEQLNKGCRRFITSGDSVRVEDGLSGDHSPFAGGFLDALEKECNDGLLFLGSYKIFDYIPESTRPKYGSFGSDTSPNSSDFLFKIKANTNKQEIAKSGDKKGGKFDGQNEPGKGK